MRRFFFSLSLIGFMFLSCDKKVADTPKTDAKSDVSQKTDSSNNAGSSITAQQGGEGFESIAQSLGYVTAKGKQYADPKATKGGEFHTFLTNYPNVLRYYGPYANSSDVYYVAGLMYSASLISFNAETSQWERGLADWWKFSEDNKTLLLRLNPNVKWSDGSQFTVDDVIATHEFLLSDDLSDPLAKQTESKFKMTKISDHILQIDVEKEGWKNWIDLAGNMSGYVGVAYMKKEILDKTDPKTYIEKYAKEVMPGLGPYTMDKEKSVDQESIVLRRNPNWWGNQYEEMQGMYNFDTVEYKIMRDEKVLKESFKSGILDIYLDVPTNDWYGEFLKKGTTFDPLKRNLMVKKFAFTGAAMARYYFIFNLRKKPFDNFNLRRAMALGFNRDRISDKMYRGDMIPWYSQNVFSKWGSPNVERYKYDPAESAKLLDEAGYNIKDADGTRKNAAGERLEFTVYYHTDYGNDQIHTLFQEDMSKIGIKINLITTDYTNTVKKLSDQDFEIMKFGLESGMFPQYELDVLSSLADKKGSNNFGGFKNPEVDKLIGEFLLEKDVQKRMELSWKIDEIVSGSFTYIYTVAPPYNDREIHWNRFGTALGYSSAFAAIYPVVYWYVDKEKDALLQKAKEDKSIVMEEGDPIMDPFGTKPKEFVIKEY